MANLVAVVSIYFLVGLGYVLIKSSLVTGALLKDVVIWPYSIYQWVKGKL